jgi:two-component system sensor histidine kinase UhpB
MSRPMERSGGWVNDPAGWTRRITGRVLGVPLVAKLIGANIIIIASAIILEATAFGRTGNVEIVTAVVALAAASAVNAFLVRLALRPIEELEHLAKRVSAGQFDVRGKPSPYADKDLSKLGEMVNHLLDSLDAERKRIRDLGVEVVRAHDIERASVSRELHDSIAQTLAAVRFQLAAAAREEDRDEVRNRLAAASGMILAVVEEVMNVSYSLHSRVAEELGLEAALGTLARQIESRFGVDVRVSVAPGVPALSADVSATLFKVADEALRNMQVMHTAAKLATVDVSLHNGGARIEVTYDSSGPAGVTSGLASVKDRVMLSGGRMTIHNASDGETRVIAELKAMKAAS